MTDTQVMTAEQAAAARDQAAQWLKGAENYKASSPITGKPILRFVKSQQWFLGTANDDYTGESVALNPFTIRIGYVVWEGGQVVAETPLISFAQGWPAVDIGGLEGREAARKFVVEGRHLGEGQQEFIFSVATFGGAKAMELLVDAIVAKARKGSSFMFPVVQLGSEVYRHREFGPTANPKFTIVGWMDANGAEEGVPALPAPPPKVRRPLI